MPIRNACNIPLNQSTGTTPELSGALLDLFQPMSFQVVTKTVEGYKVKEKSSPINFRGLLQPLSAQRLAMKPEGERKWIWQRLHATPDLELNPDDVIVYNGVQYRVMAKYGWALYGYVEYELVNDYTGAGPT